MDIESVIMFLLPVCIAFRIHRIPQLRLHRDETQAINPLPGFGGHPNQQ